MTCISGEVDCPLTSCTEPGEVDGNFAGSSQEEDVEGCWQACQDNMDCHFYTFNTENKLCFLLRDFKALDPTCTACLWGEKSCVFGKMRFYL